MKNKNKIILASKSVLVQKQKTNTVISLLERVYGIPKKQNHRNPVDVLIGTILSQNTNDANSRRAHANLTKRFKRDYTKIMNAPTRTLARIIRAGGLANIKAKRIKQTLRAIREARGNFSLNFLHDVSTEQSRSFMRSLPGVGPKTAAVVLHFCFNKPTFPIDTHIFRVIKRLRLIPEKTSYEKAHLLMEEIVPKEKIGSLHLNLIAHGRKICIARSQKCGGCVLLKLCPCGKRIIKNASRRKL